MQLRSLQSEEKPLLMIIPMIDIIFFLLVFFMMSMLTMVTQKTIPLQLPQTTAAKVDTTKTIPISITGDGELYIEDQPVSLASLSSRLSALKAENEKLTIVLRGDTAAQYGIVVAVLDVVRLCGIYRVSIATDGKRSV